MRTVRVSQLSLSQLFLLALLHSIQSDVSLAETRAAPAASVGNTYSLKELPQIKTNEDTLQSNPTVPAAEHHSSSKDGHDDNNAVSVDHHQFSLAQRRAFYVRNMLSSRLTLVEDGKRLADVTRWIKQKLGGETTAVSFHGAEAESMNFGVHQDESNSTKLAVKQSSYNPFPLDRMNLDLPEDPNSPPNCFSGVSTHLADDSEPSFVELFTRAITLGINFAPVLSTVGLAVVWKGFRERYWFGWLASCLASSGPAWIKWGQWSSTRSDMFPEALCDQLSTLHKDAPAHPWSFSEECVESSLGLARGTLVPLVFDAVEHTPIASGSIAQVHRAVLNGRIVAIKIRHPRVAQLIDRDFRIMTALARIMDYIPGLSWLHVRESVAQFSHTMAAQSYLNVEAHHLELLSHNFRKWKHVRFPQPIYASRAVIMETFESGEIVTGVIEMYNRMAADMNAGSSMTVQYDDDTSSQSSPLVVQPKEDSETAKSQHLSESTGANTQLVRGYDLIPTEVAKFLVSTGLGVYLKMLLVDNLMHADLHPGNIMIDLHRGDRRAWDEKKNKNHSRDVVPYDPVASTQTGFMGITLVDAGMVAQLTEGESATFIGLLSSVGEGDGKAAAEFSMKFSAKNKMNEAQRQAFINDMVDLFAEKCKGYGTNVDVGSVLRSVLSLIRKHRVRIDANYATLVVNCLCIESLAHAVCPSYNVLDAAQPLLQSYRRLCYNKDNTLKVGASKSQFVKLWLSLMYAKKQRADNAFFNHQQQERDHLQLQQQH